MCETRLPEPVDRPLWSESLHQGPAALGAAQNVAPMGTRSTNWMSHMSAHTTDHLAIHNGAHVADPAPRQKKNGEVS